MATNVCRKTSKDHWGQSPP